MGSNHSNSQLNKSSTKVNEQSRNRTNTGVRKEDIKSIDTDNWSGSAPALNFNFNSNSNSNTSSNDTIKESRNKSGSILLAYAQQQQQQQQQQTTKPNKETNSQSTNKSSQQRTRFFESPFKNNNNNNNKNNNQTSTSNSTASNQSNLIFEALENNKMVSLKPKTNQIYDDYIISKQVLGLGISGKVLCCTHKQTKVKYALKTLRDSQKARREIDLQWRACKSCEYIVQIIDVYENVISNQKVFLIVMECMEGGELFAKISERTTPFTEQEVAKIMFQICTAVKHLHSMKIAHRDLKPENLLLTSNDASAKIKLTDFGFAKEVLMGLATPCYTPYYVAPEVLGSERYDISCDIWSLGVIMYILCCGYPPFYSTHGQPISPGMKRRIKAGEYAFPEAEWSRVSKEAKDLISGMLETIPERRSTIDDIMRSDWISRYYNVPQTPLPSLAILKEDKDNWDQVRLNMNDALDEMRINWDSKVVIKELGSTKNPLLEKRMKKAKPSQQELMQEQTVVDSRASKNDKNFLKVDTDMEVDDLTREPSMVSIRTITPTNSRPNSPGPAE